MRFLRDAATNTLVQLAALGVGVITLGVALLFTHARDLAYLLVAIGLLICLPSLIGLFIVWWQGMRPLKQISGDLDLDIERSGVSAGRILDAPQYVKRKLSQWQLNRPMYVDGWQWRIGRVLIVNREPNSVNLSIRVGIHWQRPSDEKNYVFRVDAIDDCVMKFRPDLDRALGTPPHLSTPLYIEAGRSVLGHLEFPIDKSLFDHMGEDIAIFNALFVRGEAYLEIRDYLSDKTGQFKF